MVNYKDKIAYEMRNDGAKYKDICEKLGGVSVSVVRMRVKRYASHLESTDEFKYLSSRSRNALSVEGIETLSDLRNKFKKSIFWWKELSKIKNAGKVSYNEICDFAGFPEQKVDSEEGAERCNCCGQIIRQPKVIGRIG